MTWSQTSTWLNSLCPRKQNQASLVYNWAFCECCCVCSHIPHKHRLVLDSHVHYVLLLMALLRLTFCHGSELPPPGSCQGWDPWWWGTCCRQGTSCPLPGRFGACGMGRVSVGSSQRSPNLLRLAPSRACCAASAERNRIMALLQRKALYGCCWVLLD